MRAVLLSQPAIAKTLDERFVLAWNCLRPAPKVTIDFGNGRVLKRTLKGNTVFYVCRPDGTVVEALPGVYLPEDFQKALGQALELVNAPDDLVRARHLERSLAVAGPATVSKAAIESPLMKALEVPDKVGSLDMSARSMSLEELEADYLPGEGSLVEKALAADSRASMEVLRPAVSRLLAGYTNLPSPGDIRNRLYREVLQVDLEDPYLGLKLEGLPGTP